MKSLTSLNEIKTGSILWERDRYSPSKVWLVLSVNLMLKYGGMLSINGISNGCIFKKYITKFDIKNFFFL